MMQNEDIDGSKPLPNARHEAFAQLVFKGASQSDAYRKVYPRSKSWKDDGVHVSASRLAAKVLPRISWLQSNATDESICTVLERKRILSERARANITDYIAGGPGGRYIEVSKDSPNPRAIKSLKGRTIAIGEGDGKQDAMLTDLSICDPETAIDILNKMDRIYKSEVESNTTYNIIIPWGKKPCQPKQVTPSRISQAIPDHNAH